MKMKSVLIPAIYVCLSALPTSDAAAKLYSPVKSNDVHLGQGDSINDITGTYQIQVIESRNKPYIPGNLTELVLNNRHATERKYIKLGSEVRLMVLPLSEINSPGFRAIEPIAQVSLISE
jgi:hypothetical protein